MNIIMKKIVSKIIIRCSHEKCPVKYPEVCLINFPSPCPYYPEAAPIKSEKEQEKEYEKEQEKENDKILGRWKPHSDFKKTAIKVDYANVDHCGPCGADDVRNMTNVSRK